ncbi:MAG: hypothetical protein EKK37_17385 [Sphingobacteriales bacterium]|nr:MAG: hypothetical protein EKK37_17385 [Sphingobacteriales bacterium]
MNLGQKFMPKPENYATEIGGILGGITAKLLSIELFHLFEIALYAFIGASVGEGVKEAVKYYKEHKNKKKKQ